jgi:hypothetical protein
MGKSWEAITHNRVTGALRLNNALLRGNAPVGVRQCYALASIYRLSASPLWL